MRTLCILLNIRPPNQFQRITHVLYLFYGLAPTANVYAAHKEGVLSLCDASYIKGNVARVLPFVHTNPHGYALDLNCFSAGISCTHPRDVPDAERASFIRYV